MKIVIVEDEAPTRDGMGRILQKIDEKYELVGKASDGAEGLKLIQEVKPDLVIMDIRMPEMDGLAMLSELRRLGINCKAIVLSAYSDFEYAKRAIELGIDNYLLKPVRIAELRRALSQAEGELEKEKNEDVLYSLRGIFLDALTGQLKADMQLDTAVRERYGFSIQDPVALFLVYMEKDYETYCDTITSLLEDVSVHKEGFRMYLIELPNRKCTIAVLYNMGNKEELYTHFKKSVVPMLCGQVRRSIICVWEESGGLVSVHQALMESGEDIQWNILLGKGALISTKEIENIPAVTLKYPIQVAAQTRKMAANKDFEGVLGCLKGFLEYIMEEPHHPKEIKEACVHYCMDIIEITGGYAKADEGMLAQSSLQAIGTAVSLQEIEDTMEGLIRNIFIRGDSSENVSMLVQKAQQMIQQYYNQGITLDEISRKLRVSEEYLSTQFRKETGKTFSETIRKCRIEKVKELLLNSTLKLNQIADMAGYSDPKYMSRVFKEEVGMLPAEYRKFNS